jgi:hypothetical protein
VHLERQGAQAFFLNRAHEYIEVPRSAFADEPAFEAFALAAQSRIWAALR